MCPAKPTQDPAALQDVESFLAGVPAEQRSALERLRAQIRAAAPEAIEMISYGVPAFKYKGRPLVSYAAAKIHCSFFVQSPVVMEAHAELLAGYNTSKGTVRFQPEQPLPEELVHALVRARMAETDTKA
ncbi:MAG: DUF1801 domain-containing protein [Anaerolineales bacterium]|nr:DUF1801 domain-containing protein [Anaerolineales bacterium]MCW5856525.1 DUF1801 domain-containing protein [Anaerolineales bacterium]